MSDTQRPGEGSGNHDRHGAFAEGNKVQQAKTEAKVRRRAGLAQYLRAETKDGKEIGERMLSLCRDPDHPAHFKALEWVDERVCGPKPTRVQVTGANGKPLHPFADVSVADLLALAKASTEGK